MLKCLPGSTQPTLLFYSSDDGMVKVHNNTIRRKWKEGGIEGRKGGGGGDIERRERRGVNGELHMEVGCGGKWTD